MDFLQEHPALLALGIFAARILDVSLGTLRTILVFRGHRLLAAAIGFVEVLIWVAAAGQVLKNLDAWYLAVAYAAGFGMGNVVGMWLEAKIALGTELVRAVSERQDVVLADHLRRAGYMVTALAGRGAGGAPVEVLLAVERRRRVPAMLRFIYETDPEATCTMSDVRQPPTSGPARPRRGRLSRLFQLARHRK